MGRVEHLRCYKMATQILQQCVAGSSIVLVSITVAMAGYWQ